MATKWIQKLNYNITIKTYNYKVKHNSNKKVNKALSADNYHLISTALTQFYTLDNYCTVTAD